MSNTNTVSVRTSAKGFGPKRERTIVRSKLPTDIKIFVGLFGAVMRQTAAPRCAQNKYLSYIGKQLRFRGSGFLAQCRNYPVFGLRILGGDVSSERSTKEMFKDVMMRKNADGILLPTFMSWYWNRLWELRKVEHPSKVQALEVSRILAVLSFAKFYQLDSVNGRKRAVNDYVDRIRHVSGKLPQKLDMEDGCPLYDDMVSFIKRYHSVSPIGKSYKFDRRCYSLKCLTKSKRPYRPPVPPAYGLPNIFNVLGLKKDNGDEYVNNFVNVINQWYYSKQKYDAKACVISEPGGKYRGICPYSSPYAHCTNLYKEARNVLLHLPGNCNYDQSRGHKVALRLSRNHNLKVSVDASNFTDMINIEHAAWMAMALGSHGSIHYHSHLRIMDPNGTIIKGCIPLMGWKGTFDLASVLLAFSFWKNLGPLKRSRVQCGDDYLGEGTLEEYRECYDYLGLKLSEEKTIVSRTVTFFCGEMFWRGLKITPYRFLMTRLSDTSRFVGKLINRTRDFVAKNNYSPAAKRTIYRFLKERIGSRYKGYLDFRLSSDLGGIPLDLSPPMALLPYIESSNNALKCCLCNIPRETEEFLSCSTYFSHLPLGKPYNLYGLGTTLTPGSWPKKSKLVYSRRRREINYLLSCNRVDSSDVLLYVYDGTMLKA